MQIHIRNEHTKTDHYRCKKIDYVFYNLESLKEHKYMHMEESIIELTNISDINYHNFEFDMWEEEILWIEDQRENIDKIDPKCIVSTHEKIYIVGENLGVLWEDFAEWIFQYNINI